MQFQNKSGIGWSLSRINYLRENWLHKTMNFNNGFDGITNDFFYLVFRTKAPDEEVKMAEDKFAESLHLAQVGMHNLIDGSGVEHISQVRISVGHTQLM